MNAMPVSAGVAVKKALKAAKPPAEAPMPTIKPTSLASELVCVGALPPPLEGPDRPFSEVSLPRSLC
jgi:hypothetical protein